MLVKAVHFVSCGLTPPYKGWREKSNAMLSWCPTEGALPPGGNESRGGLLPVDLHVWEVLDFKAKLPDYKPLQGVSMEDKLWKILYRDPGINSSGMRMKIWALTCVFLPVCPTRKMLASFYFILPLLQRSFPAAIDEIRFIVNNDVLLLIVLRQSNNGY